MKTIETKYIGPDNVRGSCIKATDGDRNTVTLHYNSALNSEDNHKAAALALCRKFNWKGRLQGGHTKAGMVWTFIDKQNQFKA